MALLLSPFLTIVNYSIELASTARCDVEKHPVFWSINIMVVVGQSGCPLESFS